MAELIFEIFSEEIPAKMQIPACELFKKTFEEKLNTLGIFYKSCKTYVTPRRLILYADGLSLTQEDSVAEKKGPKIDADKLAIEGFQRSTGLTKDQLTIKTTPKGDFYFAIIRQKGKPTVEILKNVLEEILNNFTWPKSMRWADYNIRWIRPIQNIACVFGNEVLDIKFGHLSANNKSYGHRFLGNNEIKISTFDVFERDLEKNYVVMDQSKRKKQIHQEALSLAQSKKLTLIEDESLLNEITGLVEWPCIMMGEIDPAFMHLPEEVLITTIRINQKYFCLKDRNSKLSQNFIFVSNIKPSTGHQQIIEGNQRVLRARLSDAKFFFKSDKEKGLESFIPKLSDMIFHAKLGSVLERSERIIDITEDIIKKIAPDKKDLALKAAQLCKADLATGMVGEFPELQGIMGYYYAIEGGEKDVVAHAIKDHYSPLGPNDKVPLGSIAASVALAEKIEALVSLFAAGERATGSKDPYALRRLSLGIIRIIEENKISIELRSLFKKTIKLLPSAALKGLNKDELTAELIEFLSERLKHQLKSQNYSFEVINCILQRPEELDLIQIKNKILILEEYKQSVKGSETIDAFKRALNILQIEEKKDNMIYRPNPSSSILVEGAEKALLNSLDEITISLKSTIKDGNFSESLMLLTKLPTYINNFYDNTLINTEEKKLRENRLKLSALVVDTYMKVADFNKL